jgi:hypothetical protein
LDQFKEIIKNTDDYFIIFINNRNYEKQYF